MVPRGAMLFIRLVCGLFLLAVVVVPVAILFFRDSRRGGRRYELPKRKRGLYDQKIYDSGDSIRGRCYGRK